MVYFINRGLILEQAIVEELKNYFNCLRLDKAFFNFHINITNKHPFETLYFGDTDTVADVFPAIVVTTTSDRKPAELTNLIPQVKAIGLDAKDIDFLVEESRPESENRDKKAGICTLIEESAKEELLTYLQSHEYVYGYETQDIKQDSISIEIWCENNQLKNEIYEHTRLFLISYLQKFLDAEYKNYSISYNPNTISGQRSNNYNLDFDVALSGAQISIDIDYSIQQIVLDTELDNLNANLIWEVHNHVRNSHNR